MASRPERCAGLAPPPSLLGFWEMAWRARSSSASCVSSFAWPACERPFLRIAGQMGPLLLPLQQPSPVLVCCWKIVESSRRGAAQPASSCSNAVLHSPCQLREYEKQLAGTHRGAQQQAHQTRRSAFSAYLCQVLGKRHILLACIKHPICSAAQPVSPSQRAAQPVSSSIAGFMKAWEKEKTSRNYQKRREISEKRTAERNAVLHSPYHPRRDALAIELGPCRGTACWHQHPHQRWQASLAPCHGPRSHRHAHAIHPGSRCSLTLWMLRR